MLEQNLDYTCLLMSIKSNLYYHHQIGVSKINYCRVIEEKTWLVVLINQLKTVKPKMDKFKKILHGGHTFKLSTQGLEAGDLCESED